MPSQIGDANIFSIEFELHVSLKYYRRCTCICPKTPQKDTYSQISRAVSCLLHKLYISPNELAEHSMKQYWKEIVSQKYIDDARKILGNSITWWMMIWKGNACFFLFFFPPEWENNQTFNTLNDSSFHNWTKTAPQSFSLRWILKVLIEYKPLRQYPSNLTFCLIVKQHLNGFSFYTVFIIYLYMYI